MNKTRKLKKIAYPDFYPVGNDYYIQLTDPDPSTGTQTPYQDQNGNFVVVKLKQSEAPTEQAFVSEEIKEVIEEATDNINKTTEEPQTVSPPNNMEDENNTEDLRENNENHIDYGIGNVEETVNMFKEMIKDPNTKYIITDHVIKRYYERIIYEPAVESGNSKVLKWRHTFINSPVGEKVKEKIKEDIKSGTVLANVSMPDAAYIVTNDLKYFPVYKKDDNEIYLVTIMDSSMAIDGLYKEPRPETTTDLRNLYENIEDIDDQKEKVAFMKNLNSISKKIDHIQKAFKRMVKNQNSFVDKKEFVDKFLDDYRDFEPIIENYALTLVYEGHLYSEELEKICNTVFQQEWSEIVTRTSEINQIVKTTPKPKNWEYALNNRFKTILLQLRNAKMAIEQFQNK
jgi:hypothetical protein